MIVTVVLFTILAVSVASLWRLRRRPRPNPINERQTVDYEELRAMWPPNNGAPE